MLFTKWIFIYAVNISYEVTNGENPQSTLGMYCGTVGICGDDMGFGFIFLELMLRLCVNGSLDYSRFDILDLHT